MNFFEINYRKKLTIIFIEQCKNESSPGGLEPPTFRLTAERAKRLRHGDFPEFKIT